MLKIWIMMRWKSEYIVYVFKHRLCGDLLPWGRVGDADNLVKVQRACEAASLLLSKAITQLQDAIPVAVDNAITKIQNAFSEVESMCKADSFLLGGWVGGIQVAVENASTKLQDAVSKIDQTCQAGSLLLGRSIGGIQVAVVKASTELQDTVLKVEPTCKAGSLLLGGSIGDATNISQQMRRW